jgi:hypothetical protein
MSEDLEVTWSTYEKLCKKLDDPGVNRLLDELGERLIVCPFAIKTTQKGCEPGGLINYHLGVTDVMRKVSAAVGDGCSTKSILKVGLLHEIGKVGDEVNNLFLDQDSSWHREKLGQLYKYNEQVQKMPVAQRTLYLLQHFGVNLTLDEWISIQVSQGLHCEENKFYIGSLPSLAVLLNSARSLFLPNKIEES